MRAWLSYGEGEGLADGDPDRAIDALPEALETARECGAAFITGVAGLTLTGVQVHRGDPSGAARSMVELLEHWRKARAWVQLWISMRTAVEILIAIDDVETAALALGAVLGSASDTEVGGADAALLEMAGRTVEAGLDEAAAWFDRGATMDRSSLVDRVIASLRH